MTPEELYELIVAKWGKSYDLQVRRIQGTIYVQVMWKYLEQVSFPMNAEQYQARLQRMAGHLTELQVAEQVQEFILATTDRPRVGKAVNIPLSLNLGARSSEWLVD